MSDVSQGPGWWLASDSKWYPPQQAQALPPPPSSYYPPAVTDEAIPTKTNGMAVVSFVLSLLWLGGLGSLLAIIFAIVARKRIRESRGSLTGDTLAIAGLILGILGLVGILLIVFLAFSIAPQQGGS
jgi:hypothetical protein